ncbi:MAG: hypothetical protein MZV70_68715 [Desulfobacterales bacterium]|nr:hypothetical protein [Desulfobacterales bacterium]
MQQAESAPMGQGFHVRRAMKRRLEAVIRHLLQHLDRGLTGAQVTEIQYFLLFIRHMPFLLVMGVMSQSYPCA